MSVAIVTGAGGLVGAEAVRFLAGNGLAVVGLDNDTRATPFAPGPGWSARCPATPTSTPTSATPA